MGKRRKDASPGPSPSPAPELPLTPIERGSLALALALWAGLGLGFIRSAAPTYDEAVHLASGYSYWATGRYRLNVMDHPPFAEMLAAVPLVFLRPQLFQSHPFFQEGRLYHYADFFLFNNSLHADRLAGAGRAFSFLTLSALLGWALFRWARRLGGPAAALGAVGAAALMPVLLSNLCLITTDGASSVLFFLVFHLLSAERTRPAAWAAAGACLGLALASKFNMILLGPLAGGMLLIDHGLRIRHGGPAGQGAAPRPAFPWGGLLLAGVCALACLAFVYRFGQAGLFWEGLVATLRRLGQGRSSFLLGEHSIEGSWLYFPVALAVKTPIPILLLGLFAAVAALREGRREAFWIVLPMAGYFAASLSAKVQIGVRHLMPILPFLALLAGLGAAKLWERGGRARALCAGLFLWALVSVLRAQPHLLAYFNEVAGGPSGGHRWLVDSNLDWGQDLKSLGKTLHELGDPPVYLSYFGSADPAAYGIRYVPVAMCCNVTRTGDGVDPAAGGRVLFALSATNLQAVYFADKTTFDWTRSRAPLKRLGHSIFLYDLTADPDGRRELAGLLTRLGDPGRAKSLLLR